MKNLLKLSALVVVIFVAVSADAQTSRESFNENWRFQRNDPAGAEDKLLYEKIKDWVRATGNEYVLTSAAVKSARPAGNLGEDVAYTQSNFDDSSWRTLNLPHDWAIEG